MKKIWYIIVDTEQEGPYTVQELFNDDRVDEDTLAWREGFNSWQRIRDIPELKELFERQPAKGAPTEKEAELEESEKAPPPDELVLEYGGKDPTPQLLIAAMVILLLTYLMYKMYWS